MLKLTDDMTISSREDLEKVLDYTDQDTWIEPFIFEVAAVGMKTPIMSSIIKENGMKVKRGNGAAIKADVGCSGDDLAEAMNDMGMFLAFPKDDKMQIFPLRGIGWNSTCQRAGISGSTINNFDTKSSILEVLPVDEKAQWLSRGFSLHKAPCKILIREEKVSAMLSQEYTILPDRKLVEAVDGMLEKVEPKAELASGLFSHEYLLLDYDLKDEDLSFKFEQLLTKVGCKVKTVRAMARFVTSDIGNSCVKLLPAFEINGTRLILGNGISMKHTGDVTPELFGEQIQDILKKFQENEDRIEELGNISIEHPVDCMRNILAKHSSLISGSETVLDELKLLTDVTAIDLYIGFNQIIENKGKARQLSPSQLVNLTEEVSKLMFINYKEYDKPCLD